MTTTKAYKGLPMEGIVASWYARTTLKDLKRHKFMAKQQVENIPKNGQVLEIAPGPGYFCIELARLGKYQITGLDISKSFVEIARKNAVKAGLNIDFRQGNVSAMPFANETFDYTFCQAAFKNFSEPVKAIAEMYRVLKPHGVAVIVDLNRGASPEGIEQEIKDMGLGRINESMVRWTFKQMLLKSAYNMEEMKTLVSQTPFARCKIEADGISFQVLLKKN
ncbi:MAG: class I SAM-dependent methyltransferase [Chloroflexi bacterium HGW-Chloroflexi-10]|nr:MAG: class I SAM-dependent methyltransferase [Chloroflexi bacterium HGW-Chloroflexi-10]